MNCPRCGKQNEDDARFCARCGIEMATIAATGEDEAEHFCHRHPKRATRLSCGRCGKPVCTDCVKLGPAGPRCADCARSNVAVRPAAVALEAKRGLMRLVPTSFWGWWVVVAVLGFLATGVNRCNAMLNPTRPPVSRPAPDAEPGEHD